MPVLDATILIDVERRDPRARRAIEVMRAAGEPLVVPAQAAVEYLAGASNAVVALQRLHKAFVIHEVGDNEILETARLGRLSKERGHRPRWADASIASVAMLLATYVVTANPRDFLRMDVPTWDYRNDDRPTATA